MKYTQKGKSYTVTVVFLCVIFMSLKKWVQKSMVEKIC
ncbi:hypothetical protein F3D3_0899 [Fusibacter sp. 3D3]|nr:hypothetical protein F3D3_0899 [Fusibacter sp. 3D3]